MQRAERTTLTQADQQAACRSAFGLPPNSPVAANFWTFNRDCAGVPGWDGFIAAAWNHERGHYDNGVGELKKTTNNIYLRVEKVFDAQQWVVFNKVTDIYGDIQGSVATAQSVEPTGNWTTPFWIWESLSSNRFLYVTQGF